MSYHKAELANGGIFHIEPSGGSVGRHPSSDICLPDPQKVISGCHARFIADGDNIVITDESTNGLFVNGAATALGRGNSTPVTDGMEIGIGEYLFTIEVPQTQAATSDTPVETQHDNGVSNINFDPLADFASDPTPAGEVGFQVGADSVSSGLGVAATIDGHPKSSADVFFDPLASSIDADSQMNNANLMQEKEGSHFGNLDHGDPLADPFSPPQGQFDDALSGGVEAAAGTGASLIPEDWMTDEQMPESESIHDPALEQPAVNILERRPEEPEISDKNELFIAAAEVSSGAGAPIQAHDLVLPKQTLAPHEEGESSAEIPTALPAGVPPEADEQEAPEQPVVDSQKSPVAKKPEAAVDINASTDGVAPSDAEFEKAVLKGLMDLLAARANLKNEFRMGATLIRQTENNPLKFAANVEAAKILFSESSKNSAYLSRMEAVTQAMGEVQEHQMALLIGLRAAFNQLLQTFSPENFEENQSAGLGKIVSSSEKKAWLAYRKFYQERIAESDDPFEELFSGALSKAYLAALNNEE